jgi:hypothetical protein
MFEMSKRNMWSSVVRYNLCKSVLLNMLKYEQGVTLITPDVLWRLQNDLGESYFSINIAF